MILSQFNIEIDSMHGHMLIFVLARTDVLDVEQHTCSAL